MTTWRTGDGNACGYRTSSVATLQAHVRTQASSEPEEDLPKGGAVLCYCTEECIEFAALFGIPHPLTPYCKNTACYGMAHVGIVI